MGGRAVSRVARFVLTGSALLAGMAVLLTGCAGPSRPPVVGTPPPGPPPACTHTVSQPDDVSRVLDAASPGDVVCLTGTDLAGADVTMRRSGTDQAPIRLVGDGRVTVRSVRIAADHVSLEGVTVADGDGVLLQGSGITARYNTIHDTGQGGITCRPCTDSTIESNTINHAAVVGIWIAGQRITVHGNTISDTVPRNRSDADGIRFFGNGHRITGNTIRDISARGYSSPPHPDCFQTFDENSPPTFDVVIADNTCRNVDAQCLIATGDQHGNSDAPSDVPSIIFEHNICANNGAQAVNLRRWPNVQIRDNTFSGPSLTRAVLIIDGSTGTTVIGNTTTSGRPTVDIDGSSRPGSRVEANTPA